MGRYSQTAPQQTADLVTVVLPGHPLEGQRLAIVRHCRRGDGYRYVDAEHPSGGWIRLPLEWTDRAAHALVSGRNGRVAQLSFDGLLRLARAVDAGADCRKLDGKDTVLPRAVVPEHTSSYATSPRDRPSDGPLVSAPAEHSGKRARRLGDASSKNVAHGNGHGGRKR